ncbi:MAG: DUF1573 domain-containing protein [Lewinellaceae bacterium]|nr:DUF1573 domain-containing protein [Lewinellaceae bacterium]
MRNFKIFSLFALVLSLAVVSCKDKETTATTDAANAQVASAEGAVQNAQANGVDPNSTAPVAAAPTGPKTTVAFEEDTFDWGTINDGEKMTHVFKFKNTGSEPLIISNAKGSCGCTVPEYPKEAIAPGASGEIKVIYDSKGKGSPEGKMDTKRVTITANTDPMETYLNIKGKVVGKAAPAAPAAATK